MIGPKTYTAIALAAWIYVGTSHDRDYWIGGLLAMNVMLGILQSIQRALES
jgi:hypothetical protein